MVSVENEAVREATPVRRRMWVRLLVAGLVALLILTVSAAALAAIKKVKAVDGNKFKPKHAYIEKGDKIRWKNRDNIVHDVKAMGKKWKYKRVLQPGDTATRKFGKVGTFKYRCTIHSTVSSGVCSGMCGFVHVLKKA